MAERSYEGGWDAVIARYEARRDALDFAPGETFPAADLDLAALRGQPHRPEPDLGATSGYARKRAQLSVEFEGAEELTFLHALCIAALRKRSFPPAAASLFRRLWQEEAALLLRALPGRWLISAAVTFGDHGTTEGERRLGRSLDVFFSLLKLSEAERLYSGLAPAQPYRFGRRSKAALPLGMEPFALRSGGLDVNLLAPLILEARREPVLGPIALELMERLDADEGTLFRRFKLMRQRLQDRSPG